MTQQPDFDQPGFGQPGSGQPNPPGAGAPMPGGTAPLPPAWQQPAPGTLPQAPNGGYGPGEQFGAGTVGAPANPSELVGRGLLFAAAAIPIGVLITAVIAKLGFVAAISSLILAGLAAFLYTKGAGTAPYKGAIPLVGLIVVGLVLSFMSIIAVDAWTYASSPEGASLGMTPGELVRTALLSPEVYAGYAKEALLFVVFAVLGVFGVIKRVVTGR